MLDAASLNVTCAGVCIQCDSELRDVEGLDLQKHLRNTSSVLSSANILPERNQTFFSEGQSSTPLAPLRLDPESAAARTWTHCRDSSGSPGVGS